MKPKCLGWGGSKQNKPQNTGRKYRVLFFFFLIYLDWNGLLCMMLDNKGKKDFTCMYASEFAIKILFSGEPDTELFES